MPMADAVGIIAKKAKGPHMMLQYITAPRGTYTHASSQKPASVSNSTHSTHHNHTMFDPLDQLDYLN
jgi:hypothetical protein